MEVLFLQEQIDKLKPQTLTDECIKTLNDDEKTNFKKIVTILNN